MENNSINHNYKVEIEILSPLHIGAGSEKEWVKGLDFIQENGKVIKLNTRKMYEVFSGDIHKLSSFLVNKDEKGLKTLIGNKLNALTEQNFKIYATSTNDIKAFIKTGVNNKPFIPGSSLKGAIRSILLNHFLNGQKPKNFNEQNYFGSSTDGDEFMRFVKISDAQFDKTELVNTKIFNLYKEGDNWLGGWKHRGGNKGETNSEFKPTGFNTIYEIIYPNEKSQVFTISLSEKQIDIYNNNNDKKISKEKKEILQEQNKIPKNLFKITNEYTKKYIDKEIAFFKKYSNEQTDKIIENLDKIKNSIPDDNSACVLRMSAGSGFHSVTGDWQHNSHEINGVSIKQGQLNGKKSAKSRKIAVSGVNYTPMGFVKLRVITEAEIAEKEQQEEERRKIEQEKAEQRHKEIEEQQKLTQQFNNLTKEAEELDKNADLSSKIENCKVEIEKIEEQKRIDEEIRKNEELLKQKILEEQKRHEANKKQLEELLNKGLFVLEDITEFIKGKNIIKKYKQNSDIDNKQYGFIKSFIKRCIENEGDKGWKSIKRDNWKEVCYWVNKETAQQWFDEFLKK